MESGTEFEKMTVNGGYGLKYVLNVEVSLHPWCFNRYLNKEVCFQILLDAVSLFIRDQHHSLRTNTIIELPAGNRIGEKKETPVSLWEPLINETLTLSKAQALVSRCVKTIFINEAEIFRSKAQGLFEDDEEDEDEDDLNDLLEQLSLIENGSSGKRHSLTKNDNDCSPEFINLSEATLKFYPYQCFDEIAEMRMNEKNSGSIKNNKNNNIGESDCDDDYDDDDDDEEDLCLNDKGLTQKQFIEPLSLISKETLDSVIITALPSSKIDGLWDHLFFETYLKKNLLNHCKIGFYLSSLKLNSKIIESSKLIILSGPPGSGKTSVCKAIAQKLSTRLTSLNHYEKGNIKTLYSQGGLLIELNCSKLFSRWYGESAKKVSNLFNDFEKMLQNNKQIFIVLLIDEIETIAGSRKDLISKNEASDGVRVVNTLLTHLDRLKKYDNILILTTSNLIDTIDPAILDRSDSIFHFNEPSAEAIYFILQNSINELIKKNLLQNKNGQMIQDYYWSNLYLNSSLYVNSPSCVLYKISKICFEKKFSGRFVKKLSLLTLINCNNCINSGKISINLFLVNMIKLVQNTKENS